MELSTLLLAFAVLACPIGMGVMMWMMNKNMDDPQNHSEMSHTKTDRLEALHEQRQQLEQEIAEVEKIAALNAKKETLAETRSTLMEG